MQLGLEFWTWPPKYILAYSILAISLLVYAIFWIWGLIHAASTPKAKTSQRLFWTASMFFNPSTIIWYWYVWKRRVFWILFTPLLGFFLSLPFVVKSLLSNAAATKLTYLLFGLGTAQLLTFLAVLMIFPLLLRLAALLHLGKNADLSAMDRNDWVVALALPVFGFGAGLAYCAKYRRNWALASLVWWVLIAIGFKSLAFNLGSVLIPAGEEKRTEFKARVPFVR